jgi:hypothetical protein
MSAPGLPRVVARWKAWGGLRGSVACLAEILGPLKANFTSARIASCLPTIYTLADQ